MKRSEELAYERGRRAALVTQLHDVLRHLGYEDTETKKTAWVLEREAAVASLRSICEDHGDNDWPDELHLADVIEKHIDWE